MAASVIEKGRKSSPEPRGGRPTNLQASGRRGRIAATAAFLFLAFTLTALVQTRPAAGTFAERGSSLWWLNRPALPPALQEIQADLYDVFAVEADDGSANVWAAGNLGLIVHSPDGGWTWARQYPSVDGAAPDATPSTPPTAASWTPPWQSIVAHAEEAGNAAINVQVLGEPSNVRNVEVRLGDARSAQQIRSRKPDPKGTVRFEQLPVGNYRVEAQVINRTTGLPGREPPIAFEEVVVNEKQNEYYVSLLVEGAPDPFAALNPARQEAIPRTSDGLPTAGGVPEAQNASDPRANTERRTPPPDAPEESVVDPETELAPPPSHWRSLTFRGPSFGWALDQNGVPISTEDGGLTWQAPDGLPGDLDVWDFSSEEVWVGYPLARAGFRKLWFHEATSQGWGIDGSGAVRRLTQSGGTGVPVLTEFNPLGLWLDIESDTPGAPYICGAGGALGRLVTDSSTGAVSFASQESGTSADLNSIFFLPGGQTGWAVGVDGTVIHTYDAGATWLLQTKGDLTDAAAQSRRASSLAVAPWYYLSLLLVGFVLAPAFKPDPPVVTEEASVADKAVTDRPLRQGDPDPLKLGEVARGLSRFLRNENTSPPLSVAVTGRWGTGKSSLMNLVRGDLSSFDYPTVWFNAWHHQKEENLLAALLQNIRLQAVPSLLSWHGWMFRLRLYAIRSGTSGNGRRRRHRCSRICVLSGRQHSLAAAERTGHRGDRSGSNYRLCVDGKYWRNDSPGSHDPYPGPPGKSRRHRRPSCRHRDHRTNFRCRKIPRPVATIPRALLFLDGNPLGTHSPARFRCA